MRMLSPCPVNTLQILLQTKYSDAGAFSLNVEPQTAFTKKSHIRDDDDKAHLVYRSHIQNYLRTTVHVLLHTTSK